MNTNTCIYAVAQHRSDSRGRGRFRGAPDTRVVAAVLAFGLFVAAGSAQATPAGAVEVNDRIFDIAGDADVVIDDEHMTPEQAHERIEHAEGWRSHSILTTADATLSTGSVSQIEFENNLKGPITSIDPLRVLGQPFTINGNTVLVRFTD